MHTKLIALALTCLPWMAVSRADVVANGTNLNGTNLNGTNLNGTNLNGTNLNGTNLNGVMLGGAALVNVHLEGSQLVAVEDGDGEDHVGGDIRFAGADLIGAQLTGVLDNGDTLPLRVDDVTQGLAVDSDIYYYSVSYQRGDGSWGALCADAAGSPLSAIAVAGRWNYAQGVSGGGSHIDDSSRFTFACRRGAIAKCVEWGYKPWRSVKGRSLAAYHQTCTRTVRADYCGDGVSHTQDGQVMNIYDDVGVQDDTQPWLTEATWDENGARAYNVLNRSHLDLVYRLNCNVPIRVLYSPSWEFRHGARIIDETPLQSDLPPPPVPVPVPVPVPPPPPLPLPVL